MEIRRFSSRGFNANSYVIGENGHFLLIDPILSVDTRKAIGTGIVDFAVLTHEHYDHILSVNEIMESKLFPVYCSKQASQTMGDPRLNLSRYSEFLLNFIPFAEKSDGMNIEDYSCKCDNILYDNETIPWQGHRVFIKETPGHSRGSICVLLDGEKLFSGDSVFSTFETALRLPGGSQRDYCDITLKWLDSLPPNTRVFPGHLDSFLLKDRYPSGYEGK